MILRFFPLSWLLIQCILSKGIVAEPVDNDIIPETHLINLDVKSSMDSQGRRILAVNDNFEYYGPTIRVRAGDSVNLSLQNRICSPEEVEKATSDLIWKDYCETALHFHGLTPIGNENDGVPDFTQTPILSGEIYWYNFTVPENTCGTFWYHSHSAVQYGDGFRGVFVVECSRYTSAVNKVINALQESENVEDGLLSVKSEESEAVVLYEEKLITLSDWYDAWDLEVVKDRVLSYDSTTDPRIDGSLFNGLKENNVQMKLNTSTEAIVLRIINSGMSGTQIFHVEAHKLIILETDGILVKPYAVDTLSLAVGQRYTVIVKLVDKELRKGLRAVNGCNKMMGYIEKTAWFVKDSTGPIDYSSQMRVNSLPGLDKNELFRNLEPAFPLFEDKKGIWTEDHLKTIVFDYDYFSDPETKSKYGTGMYQMNEKTLADYMRDPIEFASGQILQIVINSIDHMRHPWHLHGHPFQLVSIGTGHEGPLKMDDLKSKAGQKYRADVEYWETTGKIPMTRDSINIPGQSYAAIRIVANQPGLWLLHCHVDWHVAKGLGVAFREIEPTSGSSTTSVQIPTFPEQQEGQEQSEDSKGSPNPPYPQQQTNRVKVLSIYLLIMVAINCILYKVLM